jgi:hypothetical protein
MTLTITFLDGETVTLQYVQGLEIVGPCTIEVWCFGNDSVRHRDVRSFAAGQFDMPTASSCTNSPACARRGCADCERSYGPSLWAQS